MILRLFQASAWAWPGQRDVEYESPLIIIIIIYYSWNGVVRRTHVLFFTVKTPDKLIEILDLVSRVSVVNTPGVVSETPEPEISIDGA